MPSEKKNKKKTKNKTKKITAIPEKNVVELFHELFDYHDADTINRKIDEFVEKYFESVSYSDLDVEGEDLLEITKKKIKEEFWRLYAMLIIKFSC